MTDAITKDGLLLAYYGDDFTGSTDVLESLTTSGLKTVLFLTAPSPELLKERFPDVRCAGVAGVSRAMTNTEMAVELGSAFANLKELGARFVHYKVCSTFDSSPEIGSIGLAIEIGRNIFSNQLVVPVVVGAPSLKRYTLFGNHFASVGAETYRLDRHPTMARHPITPMNESDLRLHLKKQSAAVIGLMDIFDLSGDVSSVVSRYNESVESGTEVLVFDVLDEERLANAGAVLWYSADDGPQFLVGSSGVEYALTSHWKRSGLIQETPRFLSPGTVEQLLVLSGSCSPVTRDQIEWAFDHGFAGLHLPTELLLDETALSVYSKFMNEAVSIIREGKSLVIYTATGPDDSRIDEVRQSFDSVGIPSSESGERIGRRLGQIMKRLVTETELRRVVVAGGDTSGYATKELGIYAMEMMCPVAPGGPLCRCHAEDPALDGLELLLKGGQVGKADFFGRVLNGLLPHEFLV